MIHTQTDPSDSGANLHRRIARGKRARRGLAPLEFVLWLPLLLFVTALMVNIGTMTVWRIRGEVVARDVGWRTRYPRTGSDQPRPAQHVWPSNARMEVLPDPPLESLDDEALRHPVVRGPLRSFQVQPRLDPLVGAFRGEAEIERPFPLLPRLGSYSSGAIRHSLVDQFWQVVDMGLPANLYRRTKALYEFDWHPQLALAHTRAGEAIPAMPNYRDLGVLDRDEELRHYRGSYTDFHPQISLMRTLDVELVWNEQVVPLIDLRDLRLGEIGSLPRTIASTFLSAFKERRQTLLDQLQQPGAGVDVAAAQAEIGSLETKIKQLEAYIARLPPLEQLLIDAGKVTQLREAGIGAVALRDDRP